MSRNEIHPNIHFRNVTPTDLPAVHNLESNSYPADEAASRSKLQYRQHHAAVFFRCAVLVEDEECSTDDPDTNHDAPTATIDDSPTNSNSTKYFENKKTRSPGEGTIIAFITATRCHALTQRSMSVHDPTGPLLAIHSLVVSSAHRNKGIGSALLKDYVSYLEGRELKYALEKVVLMAKKDKLAFYVKEGGFRVMREMTEIVHGKDTWFECERDIGLSKAKKERKSECWILDSFVATGWGKGSYEKLYGTGNPAAVVLVPTVLEVEQERADNPSSTLSVNPQKIRTNSIDLVPHNGDTLQDPDHESTVSWMKKVAREFNLSETAFLWEHQATENSMPDDDIGEAVCSHYTIRFYTRDGTKINICGHATLASSYVAFKLLTIKGVKRADMSVVFHAENGVLLSAEPSNSTSTLLAANGGSVVLTSTAVGGAAMKRGTGAPTYGGQLPMKIKMDLPWKDVVNLEENSEERTKALAMIRAAFFSSNTLNGDSSSDEDIFSEEIDVLFIGVDEGGDDLMVELTSAAFSRIPTDLDCINFKAMQGWDGYSRGIILCAEVDDFLRRRRREESDGVYEGEDFMSRFFGPKVGIGEDPVTGSAHCILGPYFATKLAKETVVGSQKSRRGGIVECTPLPPHHEGMEKSVSISGTVSMVMSGTLYI